MRHVCAWCKRELAADDEEPRDKISHGICPTCDRQVFGVVTMSEALRELDMIPDLERKAHPAIEEAVKQVLDGERDRILAKGGDYFCALQRRAFSARVFEKQLKQHIMVKDVAGVKVYHAGGACMLSDAKTFLASVQGALEILEAKP